MKLHDNPRWQQTLQSIRAAKKEKETEQTNMRLAGISGEYYLKVSEYAARHYSLVFKISFDTLIDIARDTLLKSKPIENRPYHFMAIKKEIINFLYRQADSRATILDTIPAWRIKKREYAVSYKDSHRREIRALKNAYKKRNPEKIREQKRRARLRRKIAKQKELAAQ